MSMTADQGAPRTKTAVPSWTSVLAVVAHPDDESFGLGAVLSHFVDARANVSVLCLTHGEASTLHGVEGDLHEVRGRELADAGGALGIRDITLLDYPDGGLAEIDLAELTARIIDVARGVEAQGLLAFDTNGITGHPDHIRATEAAMVAGRLLGVDVLAWSLPSDAAATLEEQFHAGFRGRSPRELDITLDVDRTRQLAAIQCHPSQAVPGSALWRRLELLGAREHLRWLVHAR
jgi:N-acetylglucosamine malate deacetylase 2